MKTVFVCDGNNEMLISSFELLTFEITIDESEAFEKEYNKDPSYGVFYKDLYYTPSIAQKIISSLNLY